MAIGVGFVNNEYDEKSVEDYYEEELADAPVGTGGFVADICYEKAIARYGINKETQLNMVKLPIDHKSYAEYVNDMRKCAKNDDGEQAHRDADFLLIDFLGEIGCSELAKAFLDVERWYS